MILTQKAQQIYHDAIVIDGHLAIEFAMPWSFEEKWNLIDSYHAAGLTAVTLSIANDESALTETLNYLARIRQHILSHREKYILSTTSQHIKDAKKQGKLAIRLMFQGTAPLNMNLALTELYSQLGISSMVVAYNIRTAMGDGCIEDMDGGISHLGKKLVHEMNRIGMVVDVAHSSMKTIMGAIEASTKPVVISHAGVYGVHPLPRNIKDEQIHAIARSGGVIGINGIALLLGDPLASIQKYVDHIDYIAQLVGIQHVAIGLDHLYFGDQFVEFMKNQPITHPGAYAAMADTTRFRSIHARQIVDIVTEMLRRGYNEDDCRAVLGENIMRVIDATQVAVIIQSH